MFYSALMITNLVKITAASVTHMYVQNLIATGHVC